MKNDFFYSFNVAGELQSQLNSLVRFSSQSPAIVTTGQHSCDSTGDPQGFGSEASLLVPSVEDETPHSQSM